MKEDTARERKRSQIMSSLQGEEYRHELATEIETGIAFQINGLRHKHGWAQKQLADRMGRSEQTIRRWEDPNCKTYSLKVLKELAIVFDVGLNVSFVSFDELVDRMVNITPESIMPSSFDKFNPV